MKTARAIQHHAVQIRRCLIGLTTELKSRGFTTLTMMNPHIYTFEDDRAVLDLFDGETKVYGKESKKLLRIKKMCGQNYIVDDLPLTRIGSL